MSGAAVGPFGVQTVEAGGTATKTAVESGGIQKIYGTANRTSVNAGGQALVYNGGLASGGKVIGSQAVSSGGVARSVAVTEKGSQNVLSGGSAVSCAAGTDGVQHLSGGVAVVTVVRPKGAQRVSAGGSAIRAVVSSGASQIVSSGGCASAARILSDGVQHVRTGGKAARSAVSGGGTQIVSSGGSALSTTVSSSGSVFVYKGAWTSALTVSAGGSVALCGGALSGVNTFSGASVSVASAGVRINRILADSSTALNFDISRVTPNSSAMLIESVKQKLSCSFSIAVSDGQKLGTYRLASNFEIAGETPFSIQVGSTTAGTSKLNGASLAVKGVEYIVSGDASTVSLTCGLKEAVLRKSADSGSLIGSQHNDIFYGGENNDTIYGVDGYDVSVYDKNSWGSDTIKATAGRMTLLFTGLGRDDVSMLKSNSDMLITKTSDSSQNIVVEGWNDATHNVVFASTMPVFSKWANVASPMEMQSMVARTEVW